MDSSDVSSFEWKVLITWLVASPLSTLEIEMSTLRFKTVFISFFTRKQFPSVNLSNVHTAENNRKQQNSWKTSVANWRLAHLVWYSRDILTVFCHSVLLTFARQIALRTGENDPIGCGSEFAQHWQWVECELPSGHIFELVFGAQRSVFNLFWSHHRCAEHSTESSREVQASFSPGGTWSSLWNLALTLSHKSIWCISFLVTGTTAMTARALNEFSSFSLFRPPFSAYSPGAEWFSVEFSWHFVSSLPVCRLVSWKKKSKNNFFNSQTNWQKCRVLLE